MYIPYTYIDSSSTVEVEVLRDITIDNGGTINFNPSRNSELVDFGEYLNGIIRLSDIYYESVINGVSERKLLFQPEILKNDGMFLLSNLIYESTNELLAHVDVNGESDTINAAIPFTKKYEKSIYGDNEVLRMPEKYFSIRDCSVVPSKAIPQLSARGGRDYTSSTTDNLYHVNLIHPDYVTTIPNYNENLSSIFVYKKFNYDTFKVITQDDKTAIWQTTIEPDFYRYERVRIYKNGRLLPRSKYRFAKESDKMMFTPLIERHIGDVYVIEHIPFDYNEIYVKFGKLTQIINGVEYDKIVVEKEFLHRPLDLRWYDIFINGRKLTDNDIDIIGYNVFKTNPRTVRSLTNLYIYQREIYDYRTVFKNTPNIKDVLANDDNFIGNMYDNTSDYTLDEPDIITQPINPSDFLSKDFYKRKLTFSFINPDLEQIDQDVKNSYSLLLDANGNFKINPDDGAVNARVMDINPG